MGAITVTGKGSRSRVRDRERFRKHFDAIHWKTGLRTCLNCGRAGARCADPQHTGIKACDKWIPVT